MFRAQLFVTENTREQVADSTYVSLIGRGDGLPDHVQEVRVSMVVRDADLIVAIPYEDRERHPVELLITDAADALPGTGGDPMILRAKGARLIDNDRHMPGEGGRVALVAQVREGSFNEAPVPTITALIVYRRNTPMEAWPIRREDRQARRFVLTLIRRPEIPARTEGEVEITLGGAS